MLPPAPELPVPAASADPLDPLDPLEPPRAPVEAPDEPVSLPAMTPVDVGAHPTKSAAVETRKRRYKVRQYSMVSLEVP
jgi:hypothetical protein